MNYKIIAFCTGTLCMLGLFSCAPKTEKLPHTAQVKTEEVTMYGKELSVTFPGKIRATADVNLSFRVAGTLERVLVDVGDRVRKGQILAEMDPRDYKVQLAATEAEYKRIKSETDRIVQLYKQGSISPNNYDKAIYGLQQIEAKYEAHKNALNDTYLLAPFDGYVQRKIFDKGETVGAGTPVVSIINSELPEVEISLPASDYIRRDEFSSYSCTIDVFPGEVFPLELIGISQKANLNQLYIMRLRMLSAPSSQARPTAGMSVSVTLNYKTEESELTAIPLSALFAYDTKSAVWIYDKDTQTVYRREVTPLDVRTDGRVVISKGLQPGEMVITAGVNALQEGQRVAPLQKPSSTNVGGML